MYCCKKSVKGINLFVKSFSKLWQIKKDASIKRLKKALVCKAEAFSFRNNDMIKQVNVKDGCSVLYFAGDVLVSIRGELVARRVVVNGDNTAR